MITGLSGLVSTQHRNTAEGKIPIRDISEDIIKESNETILEYERLMFRFDSTRL